MRHDELIAKALDGSLSPAEQAELDALLMHDSSLAEELHDLQRLETILTAEQQSRDARALDYRAATKESIRAALQIQRRRPPLWLWFAGAGVIILSSLLWLAPGDDTGAAGDVLPAPTEKTPLPVATRDDQTATPSENFSSFHQTESVDEAISHSQPAAVPAPSPSAVEPERQIPDVPTPSDAEAAQTDSSRNANTVPKSASDASQRMHGFVESGGAKAQKIEEVILGLWEHLPPPGSADRVRSLRQIGVAHRQLGHPDSSRSILKRALALAESGQWRELQGELLGELAFGAGQEGRRADALQLKSRSLAALRAAGSDKEQYWIARLQHLKD